MSAEQPLGRMLALALSTVLDELHDRLEQAGWPPVRPLWGFVLLAVRERSRNVGDVGELLGITKQAAAKLVSTLVAEGFVERHTDPHDRRAAVLGLTPEGERFLADAEAAYLEIEAGWARVAGRDRIDELRRTLASVLRARYGDEEPPLRPAL